VEIWAGINAFAASVSMYLILIMLARIRGLSFKEWFDSTKHFRPIQPLGERTRTFALGAGLVVMGCSVMLLVTAVQAHVWEGESFWPYLGMMYFSIYVALWTLGIAIRDYWLVHYGRSASFSRQLTVEQMEPIRRALEDYNLPAAIQRYREAVPDAGLTEANQYVTRLFHALRAQHPDQFGPPPLSLATLNWKAFLICSLIEAVVVAVLWFAMPPSYPASAVSQFAYSLLLGMGVIAGLRVKGYRKLLLLAPSLALMILSETMVPRLAGASSHSMGPYLFGFFFGVFLMVSAFTPRRQRV
jgi:hypothetical protein